MFSKIISKLSNKHFLSFSGNAIMSVFGVVLVGVLYRFLSVTDIGIWIFFQSTLSLVDTFRSGFLSTAFIKFYAGTDKERAQEVMGSTWFIALAITLGFVVLNIPALLFSSSISNAGLSLFLKWFGITFICTLPSFIAGCVVVAEQRFDKLLYIRLITQGSFILGIVLLIIFHIANLQTVVYINIISALGTSLFTLFAGYSRITEFKFKTKKGILEIFNFGKYSVGTTISSNLFGSTDTYIINFMLGPAALAVYGLGKRLLQIIEIPLLSFAATAMPALSAEYNKDQRGGVIYIMKKYTGMLTLILVPCCLLAVVFADTAVSIIGGSKYVGTEIGHQAANVFRLFMTFGLLYPADRFMALTLDVIHKPKINFIKVLIMLAANIIGDFVGIYILGNIYGVAITTVVPIFIGVLISFFALRKYLNFNFFDIYRTGYFELVLIIKQMTKKIWRSEHQ